MRREYTTVDFRFIPSGRSIEAHASSGRVEKATIALQLFQFVSQARWLRSGRGTKSSGSDTARKEYSRKNDRDSLATGDVPFQPDIIFMALIIPIIEVLVATILDANGTRLIIRSTLI